LKNPAFIRQAADIFGSQCIVCSIDVKQVDGEYKVFNQQQGVVDINPLDLAKQYQENGAGEILLTSVESEGSTNGYELKLMQLFKDQLRIPVILNGGMGKPTDAVEAIEHGADAVAAAYIFHFSQWTPNDIKLALSEHDIPVRFT